MATRVAFKGVVRDHAKLEGSAEIAIGTTGFAGDGSRLFLQWNGTGILFDDADTEAFLKAAIRTAKELGVEG
jgi:hypothetical protein